MHEKNHDIVLRVTIGIKNKTRAVCLEAFREAVCRIRLMSSMKKRQVVRVHSDFDKSFESEIKKYVMDQPWLRTRTEGYDHDGNCVTERSIRRIRQANRTLLLDCTGGRQQYRELGVAAVEHSTDISNYLAESGGTSPVQKAGGEQIELDKVLHVFGSKVLYYLHKEQRDGADDIPARQGLYLGRAKEVLGGARVVQITKNKKTGMYELGEIREVRKPKFFDGEFPLREATGERTTAAELDELVNQISPSQEVIDDVYVVKDILASKEAKDGTWYKVHWQGFSKKQATWEPKVNLIEFGAEEIVDEYEKKLEQGALVRRIMMDEDTLAVMELMQRHNLEGSVEYHLERYKKEKKGVMDGRLRELHGKEYKDVVGTQRIVRMRMNPETKKPTPEIPTGDSKFRWLVMGHTEPDSWKTGPQDAPVMMDSTLRQMVAMGSDYGLVTGNNIKQKGKVKPANRKKRQEWKRHLREEDRAEDRGHALIDPLEEDVISVGDYKQAFLQADNFDGEDAPKYVGYKPYKGATLRVYQLKGSLYGMSQAPMDWYRTLTTWMMSTEMGFDRSENDKAVFVQRKTKLRVGLHVDDAVTRGKKEDTERFWAAAARKFNVKYWGIVTENEPKMFCSKLIQKQVDDRGLSWYSVTQEADIRQFLIDEGMFGCKPVLAPMPEKAELFSDMRSVTEKEHQWIRSTVGSLNYFASQTRWDITYEINRVAQTLATPTQGTILALKRIMAYLAGTWDKKWRCPRVEGNQWDLYSDSDHAGERDQHTRSRTGVAFFLNAMPIHWKSSKQPVTSLSSAAAEIYALSEAAKDARLRWWISEEIHSKVKWPATIKVDNKAAISFQKVTNPASKLKGVFDLREAWVQELQEASSVVAEKVCTTLNLADMETKCLRAPTRGVLFETLDAMADLIANAYARHLGGTLMVETIGINTALPPGG